MLLKRTITQTNFCITSWLGLQNFLMEFYQVHEKSNFFNLFEKAICFWGKNLSTEDFDMKFKGCHQILAVYFYRFTNTMQFRTHTR